ncbi:hypothetical protein HUT16_32880 [Kitasatospora sp. NA04385]|uniref:hypothetical protein n=1 Tax=Kitasatospora sp. NA04385 TaxID=2742135 RepID=UPI0015905AD6|nr:hypothetical protein [Kitasatospora sp. NA04385]QKW23244.1 hypothetical protein HUT16_32880 [Kitasatospora sp. NA04385]
MLRTSPARLLAITLSSCCALAVPAPAGAEDTEPAVVVNGAFASPQVPVGQSWAYLAIDGWEGPGLLSAARAAHPQGHQAAFLATPDAAVPLSTRLRAVSAGATVTLSWDDNPDTCAAKGTAKRTYTVSVAGDANQPGGFATNEPTGRANWFVGRSYSFTAAEDAPKVVFTFDASNPNPGCQPSITNVAARQTASKAPPKGTADPCAGDAAGGSQCADVGAAKGEIAKCPATSRDCLSSVAGDGRQTNDGIAQQTTAVPDFGDIPRDESPDAAAQHLCPQSNALIDGLPPAYLVIPPKQWGQC